MLTAGEMLMNTSFGNYMTVEFENPVELPVGELGSLLVHKMRHVDGHVELTCERKPVTAAEQVAKFGKAITDAATRVRDHDDDNQSGWYFGGVYYCDPDASPDIAKYGAEYRIFMCHAESPDDFRRKVSDRFRHRTASQTPCGCEGPYPSLDAARRAILKQD